MSNHLFIPIFAVSAVMIGMGKGGLGPTFAAISTPLLALVLPVDQVLVLLIPVLMLADGFGVALHWRRWNTRMVLLLLPGSLLGIIVGTVFIINAPRDALRITLAVITLIFVLYKVLQNRILRSLVYRPRPWHAVFAGITSGFSSTLAHVGGPPVEIYLLLQEVSPRVFLATATLFFAIVNWIKIPFYWYAGLFNFDLIRQVLWLLPLVPVGVLLGRWIVVRISRRAYEGVILAILTVSAVLLLVT